MTGSSIRSRRLRLGWSREQLARALGVSASTLAEWEDDGARIGCPHAVELILEQREEGIRASVSGDAGEVWR